MSQEIIYTSAPRGLKPGTRGFCTVTSTEGMASNLADRLESHSGYRHAFGINDERRDQNPVNWSHTAMRVGGVLLHVLSRVSDAGLDYSGRSNKLAHHIALDDTELPLAGPARTMAVPDVFCTEWSGELGIVARRRLPESPLPVRYQASTWAEIAGDPAWAGIVAEKILESKEPLSIIFPVGADTLAMVVEVFDLLPLGQRWAISFSTYFTQLAPGTECRLRFVLDDTPEAIALRMNPHSQALDLCRENTLPSGGDLVACARRGRIPAHSLPPQRIRPPQPPRLPIPPHPGIHVDSSSHHTDQSEPDEESEDYQIVPSSNRSSPDSNYQRNQTDRGRRKSNGSSSRFRMTLQVIGLLFVAALILGVFAFCIWRLPQLMKTWAGGDGKQQGAIDTPSDQPAPSEATPPDAPGNTPADKPKPDKKDTAKEEPSPPSKGQPPQAKPAAPPSSPSASLQPDPSTPAPTAATPSPFRDLPADASNPEFAVLDLGKPPNGGWSIHTTDPASVQLQLLGWEAFLSGTGSTVGLTESKRSMPLEWIVNFKSPATGVDTSLGRFRLESSMPDSLCKLTYHKDPDSGQSEILPYLVLGLTSMGQSRLCRLSPSSPENHWSFSSVKFENGIMTVSKDLNPLLLTSLKATNSPLNIVATLGPGVSKHLSDPKANPFSLPLAMPTGIRLTVAPQRRFEPQWQHFINTPDIARIDITPQVTGTSLDITVQPFATLSLYTEERYEETHSQALKEVFVGPDTQHIPLVSREPLRILLNSGASSRIGKKIQTTVGDLNLIRTQAENDLKNEKLAINEKMKLSEQIKKLKEIKDRLEPYKNRQSPEVTAWLWETLTGQRPSKTDAPKPSTPDILSVIKHMTLIVTIHYEVTFEGRTYTVVIHEDEASK